MVAPLAIRMLTTSQSANSLDATVLPPCSATQGALSVVDLTWSISSLAPGESRVCDVELRARPNAQTGIFFFSAEAVVAGFTDPVTGNNRSIVADLLLSATDIVQDMVLTIRSPPGILRTPPNLAPVDFELSNRGPDAFPPSWRHLLRSEVYRFAGGGAESFLLFSTGDPDCDLFNDDVGNSRIDQINFTNPIPPGTSQTCTLAVAARPNATGSRSLRWDVGRLTPGLLETNPADNTAFLVMQFSPAIIPVDARWALLLLIAGLGALGGWHLRRARG